MNAERKKRVLGLPKIEIPCVVTYDEALELGLAKDWDSFCKMKGDGLNKFWMSLVGRETEFRKNRGKTREQKIAEIRRKLAKLQRELADAG